MRILIKDAAIVTMNEQNQVISKGDVAVENDYIAYVGQVPGKFKADKVIDGKERVVMPGLIDAHTHMGMSVLRNYADDLPLWEWLSEKIWPIENKLTGDDVYWASLLSIMEMVRGGITCFSDMYFFEEDIARATYKSGIRGRLARGLTGEDLSDNTRFEETRSLYKNWHNKGEGRITVMVGPHAPYTCSGDYLKASVELAKELKVGLHIHLAESKKEIQDLYEAQGKSPIKYVNDLGLFEVPTTAAHCVYLTDEDIDILKEKQVSVLYNPGSNLKLGNGFAPIDKLLEKGVNIALGTDGASSNNNLNMFEEINLAALVNKGVTGDPTCVPAETALRMATINGAKALGLEASIGSIEAGKKADLIILDMKKPHLVPSNNVLSSLVYSTQGSDVDTVIVNGKILMEKGRLTTIDEEEVYKNIKRIMKRLLS